MTPAAPGDEGSYLVVVGEDPPELGQDALAALSDRYSQVHLPGMVSRNEGFRRGTRYQLIGPDPRGDLGPVWLTVYELSGEEAAAGYLDRAGAGGTPPGQPCDDQGGRIRWHLVWRRCAGYDGALGRWGRPYLYLIGMDLPPGTSGAELAAFNEFYDARHVPEVTAALGYERGLRFERVRSLTHPGPGCPRFMAAYDGDEKAIRRSAEGIPDGAIRMDGPPAWNHRRTRWRLLYRRVASWARLAG